MAIPQGLTPSDDFAARLTDMERRIQELVSRPLNIPILNAAPDTSYAGNVWAYPDGRIVIRMKDGTVRQVSSAAASAPAGANPTPPAQPVTHEDLWTATWAQAYRSTGAKTGGDDRYLYYGNSGESSFNGRQKSLINFPYAAIAAALAGSMIERVEVYLFNVWTWSSGGGATCNIGSQYNALGSAPASYGGSTHDFISSFHTGRNVGEWHQVSNEVGSRLRDGSATGIILQAPNDSSTYYGYAAGFGANKPLPQIKITYIK